MTKLFTVRKLLGAFTGVLLLAALLPTAANAANWGYRPQNVIAVEQPDGIKVAWSPPTNNAAAVTGYKVIRKTPGVDAKFTVVAIVSDTAWLDVDATEAGRKYNYKVKAVRGSRTSKASRKASVTRSEAETFVVLPEELETARSHIEVLGKRIDETYLITGHGSKHETFSEIRLEQRREYVAKVYAVSPTPDWLRSQLAFSLTITESATGEKLRIENKDGPGWGLSGRFHPPRESSNTSGQTDYDIVARLEKGQYTKEVGENTHVWVPGLEITVQVLVYAYAPPDDDCTGTLNTNCTAMRNTPIEGSLHGDHDVDWYRVPLARDSTYEISMAPDKSKDAAAAAWITGIYNSDGEFLKRDGSIVESQQKIGVNYHTAASGVLTVDGVARTTIQTRSEGDYFIALSSYGGYGDREGHYILRIDGVSGGNLNGDDYVPGFDINGAFYEGDETNLVGLYGAMSVGYTAYGYIERDRDRDWFRIGPLVAGTDYRAIMKGLTLHDAQIGGVYAEDRRTLVVGPAPLDEDLKVLSSDLHSRLDFTVPTDGFYYIEATTPPSVVSFNNIGRYSMEVRVRRGVSGYPPTEPVA